MYGVLKQLEPLIWIITKLLLSVVYKMFQKKKCWTTSIESLLSLPHYKGLFNDFHWWTDPSPSDPNLQAGGGDPEYLYSLLST